MDIFVQRLNAEKDQEWSKWRKEIPYIDFPSDWKVKVIPPFAGAIVRFMVKDANDEWISVYLDCYDVLGCFGRPYWEAYPINDDTYRVPIEDVDALIECMQQEFKDREEQQ